MNSTWGKFLLCTALLCLFGCSESKTGGKFGTLPPSEISKSFTTGGDKIITLPSGIKYEDLKVGTGAEAEDGKFIHVHYTCSMVDGTEADSSLKKGQPYGFKLGSRSVIQGWDLGLPGMKEGGSESSWYPPSTRMGVIDMASFLPIQI